MYGSDHDVFFIDVDDEDGEEPVPHNKFRNINIEGSQSGKKPHEVRCFPAADAMLCPRLAAMPVPCRHDCAHCRCPHNA